MPQIKAGGYGSAPFAPFTDPDTNQDIGVDVDGVGLQLGVSKLAPGNQDQWAAGAVWGTSTDGGVAIAWKDGNGDYDSEVWDSTPLAEDPRATPEPFIAFDPRWVGDGCFIGSRFVALEQGVTPSIPSVNATTNIDLPPGYLIIPPSIPGLSRYDFSLGTPAVLNPQPPSAPGTTLVNSFGAYPGQVDQTWLNENPPNDPIDDLPPYGQIYSPGQIVFDVFDQVDSFTPIPAQPLTRPAQVGDELAIAYSNFASFT
ncbi:MAG: hypothetical protein AAGA67_13230, partial [Cyanobacteria bacterium P01_F01_bin.153]